MINDVQFFAKMLNRMDNMDKYLDYLGNDYLPKTAKMINKNQKNLYTDLVLLGMLTVAGGYLLIKENKRLKKQLKDVNEHLEAIDRRVDEHVLGEYAHPTEEEMEDAVDADDLD